MMLRLFAGLLFLSTILYSSSSLGDPTSNTHKEQEKFQPGDMIMHHILDAHDWHILDWKGHTVSIPLPIILFHESKGMKIFSSSKFDHGHTTYLGYKLYHGNIFFVNDDGTNNLEETAKIWDFSITKNVFSLILSIIILLLTFITISNRYKKNKNKAPHGIQSLLEPIVIFVRDDIAKSAIGEKDYKRYLPFLLTVFFFIWNAPLRPGLWKHKELT